MASVFGIDLVKSTAGLFRIARTRKKASPWGGEQTSPGRSAQHPASDGVGRLVEDEIIPRLLMVHQDDPRMNEFSPDLPTTLTSDSMVADAAVADESGFRETSGTQSNDNVTRARDDRGGMAIVPDLSESAFPTSALPTPALPTPALPTPALFDDSAIQLFVEHVLANEVETLSEIVTEYQEQDIAPETLFIQLVAPTARELGEKWSRDECDFVDVTMGVWRLQSLLRSVAARAPAVAGRNGRTTRALFTTMPDDQHSLGTLMISECFLRAGWEVETLIDPLQSDIFYALQSSMFDVIGLTVTTDHSIGLVPHLLNAMRSASCNPNVAVMIGGPAIDDNRALARTLGADGTAIDAIAALELANELVSSGAQRVALAF